MARALLLVALCLAFPRAQQQVISGRLAASIQQASGQADHSPLHDWRRVGGGTTRAVSCASAAAVVDIAFAAPTQMDRTRSPLTDCSTLSSSLTARLRPVAPLRT